MMRVINLLVIAALFAAASYVYKIKFESTRQAERIAKLRTEIRQEQDTIATLRAEWARLDSPMRIQELAGRHLALRPINPRQFDSLRNLPERPAEQPSSADPIGSLIDTGDDVPTGSVAAPRGKR